MNFLFTHGDMQNFYEHYLGIQKRQEVINLKVKKLESEEDWKQLKVMDDFKFESEQFKVNSELHR